MAAPLTLRELIRSVAAEASVPSAAGETPYKWVIVQLGHALVGSVLVAPFHAGALWLGSWSLFLSICFALVVAGLYFVSKELRDLLNGGRLGDCLADTAYVGAGAFLAGLAISGPALALAYAPVLFVAVAGGLILRHR